MIKLSLSISNPWSKDVFINFFEFEKKVGGTKYFEFQKIYSDHDIIKIFVDLSWKGADHAGPAIEFGVLGYNFIFRIYDTRHWNYRKSEWCKS